MFLIRGHLPYVRPGVRLMRPGGASRIVGRSDRTDSSLSGWLDAGQTAIFVDMGVTSTEASNNPYPSSGLRLF
jgi:hypothetical protein